MDVLPDAAAHGTGRAVPAADYAELHALSNFSFLRGASHGAELVERAAGLGYRALALTDECSMAGVVRAHMRAKETGLHLIIGSQFTLQDGLKFVALAATRRGYAQICSLITRGRRAARKGSYRLTREDLLACIPARQGDAHDAADCLLVWLPGERVLGAAAQATEEEGRWLAAHYAGALWLGVSMLRNGNDAALLGASISLSVRLGVRAVATGDVHMHVAERRLLQDVLTAIRHRTTLREAGRRLFPNGERHLRERRELTRLYPPELLAETIAIAARCHFSLDELRYQYPHELVPEGETPTSWLAKLAWEGAHKRWPDGIPERVRGLLDKELAIIAELRYEPFFLTVHDVVQYARGQHILCQGRGSAANSIVCYCLGITAVGPEQLAMLFERFVSKERDEPPDIDVDFEHERREEVIQYIYGKYGRERAALAATVIKYGAKSAVRDLIRALEIDATTAAALTRALRGWRGYHLDPSRWHEDGVDIEQPAVRQLIALATLMLDFPRHLSQHVGGFVVSEGPLSELVPVENASMPDRTVIQWDKDDLEDLRLLKVDVLALGMLTAIRKAFDLIAGFHRSRPLTLAGIPQDDPAVYRMICAADTIGVFQIESRAQMSMLPRLKPKRYYDLVIEVAIVRPGPIQGDMVHPYLRRRSGQEPITYPSRAVESVLQRTCGVPIFQEQVMQLAMVAAGFTAGEADQLRRAMAAWKRRGGMERFEVKLLEGMRRNGYDEEFARRVMQQIRGFSDYGFPEAHAASFALLAYVSAWLKHYHPAAFTAALLNSQPMGFYAPAQLLRDARAHGVQVLPVDVRISDAECTLEPRPGEPSPFQRESVPQDLAEREPGRGMVTIHGAGGPALRLGLNCVRGLSEAARAAIVAARAAAPFASARDLGERARLTRGDMEALAAAGALAGLEGHRHLAFWQVAGYLPPLAAAPDAVREPALPLLRTPTEAEDLIADYRALGFTLGRHPLALLRKRLERVRVRPAAEVIEAAPGTLLRVAGLVTVRQRPATARGVTFVTLEDESGQLNVVVWRALAERRNAALVGARLLEVHGQVERGDGGVTHLVARELIDRSALLGALHVPSHDFH
jgi:error-prone DNA polymerase